ncbi:mannitol dehydrogenase family protein [Acidaminobacter sp. JC074]|uniref:mannitol dehydrogenase family protein n=1 Tax=Acidaminobacter sp. JC074 TaxID=2530199 RepID=UPI001F0EF253|nr:mannitol dehydrogenase family protein [Acidaminobacter sp. JC074]MCH4886923.1 mannitol dehydrogenase family protein [Acidaminobacter sp. JC074]
MKLNYNSLEDKSFFDKAGITLPAYDVAKVKAEKPKWIHFGAGNIFRAFIGNAVQKLLNEGLMTSGILAVDSFDYDVINKIYKPYDNLSLLVLMNSNGNFDTSVVASITDSIATNTDYDKLEALFTNDDLQMVSFTITEKGYGLRLPSGDYLPVIKSDFKKGPKDCIHTMSMVTALLYTRFQNGQAPLTLVSMDNCSHNGDKLKASILEISESWVKAGFVDEDFISYLTNKISYPLSMIDKITPRPSDHVKSYLQGLDLEDMDIVITDKNSYVAPFVNAEVSEYLVIEDTFIHGRPPLEKAGIIFTDRETVNQVETMKVTTCLNPLHTALAVSGCLLDYQLIADQMKDPELNKLVHTIGYEEGLKVVVDPKIIDPKAFIDEVINERFSNPFIPDTPQRIATDTSQKVAIRFGETIKSYDRHPDLNPRDLTGIPLAIALWLRYLTGTNDKGLHMPLSPDPLMAALKETLGDIKLGDQSVESIRKIISNENIFGLDLYEVGLGEKIEDMFVSSNQGVGAVRETLKSYLGV